MNRTIWWRGQDSLECCLTLKPPAARPQLSLAILTSPGLKGPSSSRSLKVCREDRGTGRQTDLPKVYRTTGDGVSHRALSLMLSLLISQPSISTPPSYTTTSHRGGAGHLSTAHTIAENNRHTPLQLVSFGWDSQAADKAHPTQGCRRTG